jgi:hypothetical protein
MSFTIVSGLDRFRTWQLPNRGVAVEVTRPLTFVPTIVTSILPRSPQGRLSGRHARWAERGAVPAGGIANPHSGGSGAPVDRQKDRSARSALNRR